MHPVCTQLQTGIPLPSYTFHNKGTSGHRAWLMLCLQHYTSAKHQQNANMRHFSRFAIETFADFFQQTTSEK
jgi:hypothetical protein